MTLVDRLVHPVFATRRSRVAIDTAPSSDSVGRVLSLLRSVPEGAPSLDSADGTAVVGRAASDDAPASDAAGVTHLSYQRSLGDGCPASDTPARSGSFARQVDADAPAADAPDGVYILGRFGDDLARARDQAGQALTLHRAADASDAPATDAAQGYRRVAATTADTAHAATGTAARVVRHVRLVSEFRRMLEGWPGRVITVHRSATDASPAVAVPTRTRRVPRSATDSAPATASIIAMPLARRLVTEAGRALDASGRALRLVRAVAADSPAADVVTRVMRAPRTILQDSPSTDVVSHTTQAFVPYGPPRVAHISSDVTRVGVGGTAMVTFDFDQPVSAWSLRVGAHDPLSGLQAASWTGPGTASGGSAPVPAGDLLEGENTVSVYGRSASGLWSP